ncbi:PREDICTED: SCY1-like protein 2 [Ceratosolen solmsi marchali]|uniref:SCY1-like protein 2 n=1 Tax=Ceratosolen solmsi marchali TaxID=326594 RepID=A0AAJ6YFC6_9HYME|nr:PREDICTED: SCY1-like protein 2 [Ceratosolen solmsi marchali]
MEVLNKLRNTVSNTLSNTVSSTAHGLSQLSSVLPGNPVAREFEVSSFICSAGPGLLWKVYSGFKKSTKQKAAIFVFEKRLLDQWPEKSIRDNVVEILKKGVIQLTKLKHPQILTVQHPLEESRDSLSFATEPVFASLANLLGCIDNLPYSSQAILKDYKILDLEMKFGLFQLGESLTFLHNDVKMLHRNLCPESIIINDHGDWKIFGFDFCAINQASEDKPSWLYIDHNSIPSIIKTSMHYQAPECVKATAIGPTSDIFSLGVLICFLYMSYNTSWNLQKDISNYTHYLKELNVDLPNSLKETVKLMLHRDPELRPDAYQFIKIEYFKDIEVKTLIYLDKLFQWDNLQKSQFYKRLPQILKQFPRRVIFQKVLPALQKEFINTRMIPFLLPSILQVTEDCTMDEFNKHIFPMLKQILVIEEPPQISLLLLQKIELLLKWCLPDIVKNYIVPMMTRALDSNLELLQEHCLIALPSIIMSTDSSCIKNSIIPRIKKICLHKKSENYSLGIRVNSLLCLSKILENLDPWIVQEEILPFLQQVPCAGEPAILMAMIGIFKLILTNSKLGISKENLATNILPFLLPLCIEQSFSPKQYELLVSLVNEMVTQVTIEHRKVLHQLQKTKQFHGNISSSMNQLEDTVISSTNSFEIFESNSFTTSIKNKPQSSQSQSLSLAEKHRLAKQQEICQRMENQTPLIPSITSPTTTKKTPKDLTDTLSANNFNELNWSYNNMNLSSITPNLSINNFPSNGASQVHQNQMSQRQQLPFTLNCNQTMPQTFNTFTNTIQLRDPNTGWWSPTMMTANSSLQVQNTPKLSSEEIMDLLK